MPTIRNTTSPTPCPCCVTCECACCPNGYWTEYTFSISDLIPFGVDIGQCTGYNGSWVLKYRGLRGGTCVWSTDEVIDDEVDCEGDTAFHPFGTPRERWILYCDGSFWHLINAATTIQWTFELAAFPAVDFCVDGGDMTVGIADTAGCCVLDLPSPDETITLSPAGLFVPCFGE